MSKQSSIQRPQQTLGLRHVALFSQDLEASVNFYVEHLGMQIEWKPDDDNVYLSSQGLDNLALHRWQGGDAAHPAQRLDHIGFIVQDMPTVDAWFEYLDSHQVPVVKPPKTHRDGARSFYCKDPDGTLVQIIYHPPIVSANK